MSDDGALVYVPGAPREFFIDDLTFAWVDQDGKAEPVAAPARSYGEFRVSPDGTKVAVTVGRTALPDGEDVWILGSIRVSQRHFGAFRCFSWVI